MNTWSRLDELIKQIGDRLHSDEFERITNEELNYNFKLSTELIEDALIENKENLTGGSTSSKPAAQQEHKHRPTLSERLLALNLTECDLDEIVLEIEKLQILIDSFRNQLAELFRSAQTASGSNGGGVTLDLDKHVPACNRLSFAMDKFKFELNYLRTNFNEAAAAAAVKNRSLPHDHHLDENRLHIDLDGNQLSYKSNTTHRQPSIKPNDYSDMLTNIHLDFQVSIARSSRLLDFLLQLENL